MKTIAPDGKSYDIDNTEGKKLDNNEIEAIQYPRPNGKRRRMIAVLSDKKVVKYAREMVLSMEELDTGVVAFFARFKDEPEENESIRISFNGPGILEKVIDCIKEKYNQRYSKGE
jgi:hypothetical protein